ncbi:hypothetical protein ACFLQI_02870 [Candidatus Undinarchaeota archaeon]
MTLVDKINWKISEKDMYTGCEGIIEILTKGKFAAKKNEPILIIGDRNHLNDPEMTGSVSYTETLADILREKLSDNVLVKYLPTFEKKMGDFDQSMIKEANKRRVVIGAYSHPFLDGESAKPAWGSWFHKEFMGKVDRFDAEKATGKELWVVAGRQTPEILKLLTAKNIRNSDKLSAKLTAYLEENAGKQVLAETSGKNYGKCELRLYIPTPDEFEIIDGNHESNDPIINIPGGEVFFGPSWNRDPSERAHGRICMNETVWYYLTQPVDDGEILWEIAGGKIVKISHTGGKKAKEYAAKIKEITIDADLEEFTKEYAGAIGEFAIGTNIGAVGLNMNDVNYNTTVAEKQKGFHIAHGANNHFGENYQKRGIPKGEHIDHMFTKGNVYVGDDLLMKEGEIQTKLL